MIKNNSGNSDQFHGKKPNRGIAIALAAFPVTGLFGIHDIYMGNIKSASIKACCINLAGLGWIADVIMLSIGKYKPIDLLFANSHGKSDGGSGSKKPNFDNVTAEVSRPATKKPKLTKANLSESKTKKVDTRTKAADSKAKATDEVNDFEPTYTFFEAVECDSMVDSSAHEESKIAQVDSATVKTNPTSSIFAKKELKNSKSILNKINTEEKKAPAKKDPKPPRANLEGTKDKLKFETFLKKTTKPDISDSVGKEIDTAFNHSIQEDPTTIRTSLNEEETNQENTSHLKEDHAHIITDIGDFSSDTSLHHTEKEESKPTYAETESSKIFGNDTSATSNEQETSQAPKSDEPYLRLRLKNTPEGLKLCCEMDNPLADDEFYFYVHFDNGYVFVNKPDGSHEKIGTYDTSISRYECIIRDFKTLKIIGTMVKDGELLYFRRSNGTSNDIESPIDEAYLADFNSGGAIKPSSDYLYSFGLGEFDFSHNVGQVFGTSENNPRILMGGVAAFVAVSYAYNFNCLFSDYFRLTPIAFSIKYPRRNSFGNGLFN